jgi:hypothetical protein
LTPSELKKCWRQRIYLIPILHTKSLTSSSPSNAKSTEHPLPPTTTILVPTSPNSLSSNKNSLSSHFEYIQSGSSLNNSNSTSSLSQFIFNIQIPGLIPASMSESQESPIQCDIYQRKSDEELKFYRDYYFLKFMEGLNKLNRADDKRCYSREAILYSEHMNSNPTPDQCIAITLLQSLISSNNTTIATGTQLPATALTPLPITNSNSSNKLNLNIPSNLTNTATTTGTKMSQTQVPSLKQQQTFTKKLTSPKQKLYSMIKNYYLDSTVQNDALKTEIYTYLNQEYILEMMNKSCGIPFIENNKNETPANCFISAEAIWWCIEHVHDIENELDAILFMQILFDFGLIKHISKAQKVFIHGFYLYYIITPETSGRDFFTGDYCEVGFCDLACMQSLQSSKFNLPLNSNEIFKSYTSIFKSYSDSKFISDSPDSILNLVNVDVDPNRKSNRVEWASAVYRSNYHQLCAFELEIQWEVATGQLLAELASNWCKLANKFNYHIVAAPIDPFALPIVPNSDPLRGPIIIKLNFGCLLMNNEKYLFESYIDSKYKLEKSLQEHFPVVSVSTASNFVDDLLETNAEFMDFLFNKYSNSNSSNNNNNNNNSNASTTTTTLKIREKIERKLQDESDFVEQEFQEFIERKRIARLQNFQEAILEKFGFVRNASVVKTLYSDDDPSFFIHSSGGMFVCLPNYYGN